MSVFDEFQPLAAIATTKTGAKQLQFLCQSSEINFWVPEALVTAGKPYSGSLKDHLSSIWDQHRGFIFCLATGAVVRLIAPLLQHKSSDPAVVVIDETGEFVISLCSGHQGGADQLARLVARQIGATPVLTGGANGLNLPAVDILGVPFGWQRGTGDWTAVSAAIARHEPVQVVQQAGSTLWQQHLPATHPFAFEQADPSNASNYKARIWITPNMPNRATPADSLSSIHWHPRVLWVGIGCERGTPRSVIAAAVQQTFQKYNLAEGAIAGIATIDLKADELGLVEFCRERNVPLCCFSSDVLHSVAVPNPSTVVEAEVGTRSVAEAAAVLASDQTEGQQCKEGNLDGSLAALRLRVPKQIFRLEGQPGAVTIAIAQAEQEYTGRTGQLLLVGTGPGQLDQITPAAQAAIAQADAVIGYSLYIDQINPLLRPGQIVEALPITQERQRAQRAIALAQWGLTVAVVSSGDCGIYGMAGLVLEELRDQGWNGKTPKVQVFPGISALQAAASRVGAPLMHDFCAISLSNLLTPWEVIEKRLTAVAQADFVVALYNPRSQSRTEQIAIAQRIFLNYRPAQTPVALVRSAYREDEQVTITTLDHLLDQPIDMLTTVLIGNQSTRTYEDWMITPRGYLGFGG